MLYISLIVLAPYMKKEYLQHWMLFVGGMYLLLQEEVSEIDIETADTLFKLFLRDFSKLYQAESFTYNLHQLLHFGIVTYLWGPAQCIAAFRFEGYNGILCKCIHGSKEQGKELVNTIQLIQGIQILKAQCQFTKSGVQDNTAFMNKVKKVRFNANQKSLISDSDLQPVSTYYRGSRNKEVFTCKNYKRQEKRNNYTVCFNN